tara:strand:+ start:2670 stop:3971 length:1302 start_codon:yes stop_codon:yes gene_type:complete
MKTKIETETEAKDSRLTAFPVSATSMDDKTLLKSMFDIFSPSGAEHPMIAFVTNYLRDNEIEHTVDSMGNIYFTNHIEGDRRILLNAHMDTVGSAVPDVVEEQKDGKTVFRSINNQVIGGDDKCGVYAVLKCITNRTLTTPLSGLLCVAEETGLNGSDFAMSNHKDMFDDVVFNITIDRRGCDEIITKNSDVQLCSDSMDTKLSEWGKDFGLKTSTGSISDVSNIVKELHINGINLFAGYYNAHSGSEYVVFEELMQSVQFIEYLAPTLHTYFKLNPDTVKYKPTASYSWGGGVYSYANYDRYDAYGLSEYNGIKYYNGSSGVYSSKTDVDLDEALDMFDGIMDHVEDATDGVGMFDALQSKGHVYLSASHKSIVIDEGWSDFFVELSEINQYIAIGQGGDGTDAVISIKEMQDFEDALKVAEQADAFAMEEE